MRIHELHLRLGHSNARYTSNTARAIYGKEYVQKTGLTCIDCGIAKIKRTTLNKENVNRSKIPGERIYVDISSVNTVSFSGKVFWILAVDDATAYKWSVYVKTKDMIGEAIVSLIKSNKKLCTMLRYLRMDNGGENALIVQELKKAGINNIKYEFTAPNTPQQNGVVERGFLVFIPELEPPYVLWMKSRELGPTSGPNVHQQ